MAYTLSQLDNIEAAITAGALEVEIDGRRVKYANLDQLIKLRDLMKAELGVSTPSTARGRVWSPTISSGL